MSLNVEQIRRADRKLSAEIKLTVQMQSRIRLRFAVADPAKLEWLRNFDRKLSAEVELAVQMWSLIRLRLAIAKA
jgi:hypothetical protein